MSRPTIPSGVPSIELAIRQHRDRDVELELEIRDLRLQHGSVMVGIDLGEFLHPLNARSKEASVTDFREHRFARGVDANLAGEFHSSTLSCSFRRRFSALKGRSSRNRPGRCTLMVRSNHDQGEVEQNEGSRAMWISLFALASAAAVCLSVAAVMMEATGRDTQRG